MHTTIKRINWVEGSVGGRIIPELAKWFGVADEVPLAFILDAFGGKSAAWCLRATENAEAVCHEYVLCVTGEYLPESYTAMQLFEAAYHAADQDKDGSIFTACFV